MTTLRKLPTTKPSKPAAKANAAGSANALLIPETRASNPVSYTHLKAERGAYCAEHLVFVPRLRKIDALHQAAGRAGASDQRFQVALGQMMHSCLAGIGEQGLVCLLYTSRCV